uniref:Fruit protein n=1 Tax=Aegilops tauschii TaxID=37682 RepID=M8BC19_AEGTA
MELDKCEHQDLNSDRLKIPRSLSNHPITGCAPLFCNMNDQVLMRRHGRGAQETFFSRKKKIDFYFGRSIIFPLDLEEEKSKMRTSFDFLVKRLPGTPSARLCDLQPGDLVPVGGSVVGRGFEVTRIADARDVLVFATGSGISPIRSLIESGFGENEKIDVSLFYGVRNLQRMAYQERFSDWESRGIKIIPVLSRPDEQWTGQRGYVQNAFSRAKKIINPSSTGAILCGHKQMTEEITRSLVADGMPKDQILTNF